MELSIVIEDGSPNESIKKGLLPRLRTQRKFPGEHDAQGNLKE